MGEHNAALRAARERLSSRHAPGEPLTRAELANAVNLWLWKKTGRRFELDDHLIGKWERGVVRQPIRQYRAALRAVLGVDTDDALGFGPSAARTVDGTVSGALPALAPWERGTIVADATMAAEWDLINRRGALRGAATIVGAGLVGPLAGWLEPLADGPLSSRSGAFALIEVEALEHLVATFREWRSAAGAGLGRAAVVGQLGDVCERLHDAPAGAHTDRVFLVAAELAKMVDEPDTAAATVRAALPHLDPHRPGRLGRKLAEWHREAAPFAAVAAVAEVRAQTRDVNSSIGSS